MSKRKATVVRERKSEDPDGTGAPAGERALMVAVELGGDWPSAFEESALATVRRVLVQEEGEAPAAFSERLAAEVERSRSLGVTLAVAAIACNERADEPAVEARRRMARTLLGAMAAAKTGRVYFTAASRSSGRLHHSLSTLAAELAAEWASAGVDTSVRFGDESRSAPRHSLEPAPARVA